MQCWKGRRNKCKRLQVTFWRLKSLVLIQSRAFWIWENSAETLQRGVNNTQCYSKTWRRGGTEQIKQALWLLAELQPRRARRQNVVHPARWLRGRSVPFTDAESLDVARCGPLPGEMTNRNWSSWKDRCSLAFGCSEILINNKRGFFNYIKCV